MESVGMSVYCAIITQMDTNEFVLSIPDMSKSLHIKKMIFLASCN